MGANTAGSYDFLDGDVAEIIAYNTSLNTAQLNIVNSYLAAKYNLAIASDKYAYDATHEHEVAGIGREDAGNRHVLARGPGIVEISSASSLDDGDYLLWGHDNTALTGLNTSDVPAGIDGRFSRTWRADMTGDVGTVTLTMDLTGFEFGPESDYVLLIDADGTFSNATQHTTGYAFDSGTDVVTFTGVDFTDGDYFTLGTTNMDIISVTTGTWTTAATWNCNCVPGSSSNVTVDAGDVVTLTGAVSTGNLTIAATGTLDVSTDNHKITVQGNFGNSGTFTQRNGEVEFAGTAAQTMTGATTFQDLTVNNALGVTIAAGTMSVEGTLDPADGTLTTGGLLLIVSNATETGRIGTLGAGAAISGDVTVQRFVPTTAAAGFRHLSVPFTDATLGDWNDDITLTGIAGTGNGWEDYWTSVYWYDEDQLDDCTQDAGWVAMTDVSDPLSNTLGYDVWIYNSDLAATIDVTGTVKTGAAAFTLTYYACGGAPGDDGWNLIANPYPSQIDWEHADVAYNASVNDAIYIWNDDHGHYETWVGGVPGNHGTQYIASGQAFLVQTNAAAPTLSMTENVKTATAATFHSARVRDDLAFEIIRVGLSQGSRTDEATIVFRDGATDNFEKSYDAYKPWSDRFGYPNIASVNGEGSSFAINAQPVITGSMSIPLRVKVGESGPCTINVEDLTHLSPAYRVTLEDLDKGITTDLREQGTYSFEALKNDDGIRFVLHIDPQEVTTGPGGAAPETVAGGKDAAIPGRIAIGTGPGNTVRVYFSLDETREVTLTAFNLLGQQVTAGRQVALKNGTLTLEMPSGGLYLVRITVDGQAVTKKVMVR